MNKEKNNRKVRLIPLSSDEALSQSKISDFLSDSANKTQTQDSGTKGREIVLSSTQPSAWKVHPMGVQVQAPKEATKTAASSAEKPNTAQSPKEPPQNPSTSSNVTRKSEGKPGKTKKTAQNVNSHNIECWQINLHRCKAASYNMCEVTKNIRSGFLLIQEPWTYGTKIRGKPRG